jgi:peptidoglycan-N-acetylglucosamine deacetylase
MIAESLGGIALAGGALAYAVRSPRCSLLAPSVYRGDPARRALALTFDDGPSESTPALLEVLSKYGVRSTFFQCGANVRRLPHIARAVAAAGHEIGNHTESHPMLHFRSKEFIYNEMEAAQRAIEDSTGATPCLFRPPFGVRWFGLRRAQRRLALKGVMWSVIGLDWKLPAARVAHRLVSKTANGAIVCLHDGRQTFAAPDISVTIEAVRRVVPRWIDEGFEFETVSQILCPTN